MNHLQGPTLNAVKRAYQISICDRTILTDFQGDNNYGDILNKRLSKNSGTIISNFKMFRQRINHDVNNM